jgi:histidine kinase
LEELNDYEYLTKSFENLIITNPNIEDVEKLANLFSNSSTEKLGPNSLNDMIILVRKENEVVYSEYLGTGSDEKLRDRFSGLPKNILPDFKPDKETNNEILFHQTGYVVARQQDFYFNDGKEGSIFFLRKYTNMPAKIASIIGKNILQFMILMFFFHTILAYKMSKRLTNPLEYMVVATEEVMAGNYDYQIPVNEFSFLNKLSNSLNQMIKELNKGKKYRDRIESMRTEFIANLSHDMKTPLTSIKIHAQAIKDGIVKTPDKMEKYVGNILTKTNDMDAMLDELKVFNELEQGSSNYKMEVINFKNFLVDVVDELRYDVATENIKINLSFDEGSPIVKFDPAKIKRVINNIVFNSLKYASIRPLVIDLKLTEISELKCKYIEFLICDNGVGVSEGKLDKIFDKYYRVDPSRNQTISGNGLGLSIAKSIIEEHDGKIYAAKNEPSGLCIIINLNCEEII